MSVYYKSERYTLYQGKMQDELENLQDNSIDSIVTDPPYGLTSITKRFGGENAKQNQYGKDGSFQRLTKGFMGKEWDGSGVELDPETWKKCLRVLKPGGYLLAFGGTRTFHRIACAIEDAGFEIRDTIMWLYGSGFPKAQDIAKSIESKEKFGNAWPVNKRKTEQSGDGEEFIIRQTNNGAMGEIKETTRKEYKPGTEESQKWDGWKTALKPAYEPIIVARKPLDGSCTNNVLKYGVGALNIDGCRIGTGTGEKQIVKYPDIRGDNYNQGHHEYNNTVEYEKVDNGRFPSNIILTYDNTDYFEVCGGMPYSKSTDNIRHNNNNGKNYNCYSNYGDCKTTGFNDEGSASRYFYCAKASKRDRDEGLESIEETVNCDRDVECYSANVPYNRSANARRNTHPTVKPTSLMQYLIRLVTPSGGVVLDPFMGSGSTGKAAMYENLDKNANYKFIGVEMTEEYLPIAKARIEYAAGDNEPIEATQQRFEQLRFDL